MLYVGHSGSEFNLVSATLAISLFSGQFAGRVGLDRIFGECRKAARVTKMVVTFENLARKAFRFNPLVLESEHKAYLHRGGVGVPWGYKPGASLTEQTWRSAGTTNGITSLQLQFAAPGGNCRQCHGKGLLSECGSDWKDTAHRKYPMLSGIRYLPFDCRAL